MSVFRQPVARIGADATRLASSFRHQSAFSTFRLTAKPWTCPACRAHNPPRNPGRQRDIKNSATLRKHFSNLRSLRDDRVSNDGRKPLGPQVVSSNAAFPSNALPSQTENRRSQISKRTSKFIDDLLARASLASQHINAYTGTDYSGIEALRKDIVAQEQKVRGYHDAVGEAKSKHLEAHAKQTSAQKEIVGLLERKSSWSPADLERYMSLVRSEHLNEQDVQVAKDNLAVAERDLDDTRSLLEKLERRQYHEEQIWSDTIRRNSTWVTFGLMGVNILLLLAQIAIFEPYRRKKIVKEFQSALNEKTLAVTPSAAQEEEQIDAKLPSQNSSGTATTGATNPLDAILPFEESSAQRSLSANKIPSPEASDLADAFSTSHIKIEQPAKRRDRGNTLHAYREAFFDLFSERLVRARKVDVTNAALQGAAVGAGIMSLVFVLLRSR